MKLEVGETKNDESRAIYRDEELKKVFSGQWKQQEKMKSFHPMFFQEGTALGKQVITREPGEMLAKIRVSGNTSFKIFG